MAHHCQLSPSMHLVSGPLGLRQTNHLRCSDKPAHIITPHLQLQQTPPEHVSNPSPVQVISWDPSRPWRGLTHQPAQLGSPLYLQDQLWDPHHLSLGVWGWGSQPAHQLVVRQAGLRLRLIRCFATKHPLAPSGLTCRPRLLPMPTSGQSVDETLQAMELRWVAEEMSASLPALMTPSQTPRLHWSDRQQQRQEQHQQHMQQQRAPQLPLDRSASDDIIDVLEACGSHPQQAQWQLIWELVSASYLDRQHRVLWWRLLHGSLMCGAYKRPCQLRPTALSPAVSTPVSLKPLATCSSHARLQPQSLTGYAAFGKL